MLSELAGYTVDWSDLNKAHLRNSEFLNALAADKEALATLVNRVRAQRDLWDMSEHHRLFDKLVLHDAPDRNFRIRLHVWSQIEVATPHDHRWSFTTSLLRGGYEHVLYDLVSPDGDPGHPAAAFAERFSSTLRAGDSYTIHHTVVHATLTRSGTVSLIVRGPAEKSRALTTNPETGAVQFGLGRKDQTVDDVARSRLTIERYEEIRMQLRESGVI
ncbi:hypothetical protein [Fodinicola acaciae]|uniref:hypothetical protein n=1 Tax=Fodinicola acaciae TaxID=2681555 RepID=UPI0013D1BF34|nr:hypothetical protein [Fodinicola acaciae]